LSTTPATGSAGVLFAAPDVVISQPQGSGFSLTYVVTAYDAAGRQLAVRRSLGGADLAREHPSAGPVTTLAEGGPLDPSTVAWADKDGWVCWGQRSGTGTTAVFGAYACTPPDHPADLALVADDLNDGLLLVRVPSSVVRLEVRDAAGRTTTSATMQALGTGRLAVIDRTAGGSSAGSTVVGIDSAGRVVQQVPTGSLQPLDGTLTSS
jgi:hypothetical protein